MANAKQPLMQQAKRIEAERRLVSDLLRGSLEHPKTLVERMQAAQNQAGFTKLRKGLERLFSISRANERLFNGLRERLNVPDGWPSVSLRRDFALI